MEFEAFYNKCAEIFELNDLPAPTNAQADALYRLTNIMLETNKVMNLTAITEADAIITRHYADSLLISKFIPENSSLIDVGCGAGFPTLPLAIFRPDIKITALDSTAKRIRYVASAAEELGISNVTAVAARAEEAANSPKYRETFDIATARAVAALPIISELCLPFVKLGGRFIAMKGAKGADEVAEAANAIKICGGRLTDSLQIGLKSGAEISEQRSIIILSKTAATPKNFPRHYSKISKKPL